MQIKKDTAVTIDYVLKGDDGQTIDESNDGSFNFLGGANNIIPGLENALNGKSAGDAIDVTIEPKDAYGELSDAMIQTVQRSVFPDGSEIQVGAQFNGAGPNGEPVPVTVAEVNGDDIVIDGNHALAGKTLHFSVTVIDVREASRDELSHGHIHGAGCSH